MKAILINSENSTVTEVEFAGGLSEIYRLIGCELIDAVGLPNGDCIYVDDEGLLKNPTHFFFVEGLYAPLAGNGLVVGGNEDGEDVDCLTNVEDLKVRFLTPHQALALAQELEF